MRGAGAGPVRTMRRLEPAWGSAGGRAPTRRFRPGAPRSPTVNEVVRILPWPDPLIDTLGHDPRAPYPEQFWLPTLGPTALLLLRHIAYRFDRAEAGFDLELIEASRCLGLGERDGRNSPIARSLSRLVQFDLAACPDSGATLAVRRHVPPVNRRHIRRLPPSLQHEHDAWTHTRLAGAPVATARRNARRIALLLLGSGDSRPEVEQALGSTGFNPALARDAALWAWTELDRADPVPLRNIAAPA